MTAPDFDPWDEDDAAIDFATEPEPALQDLERIDRAGRSLAKYTAELADFDRIAAAEHADNAAAPYVPAGPPKTLRMPPHDPTGVRVKNDSAVVAAESAVEG